MDIATLKKLNLTRIDAIGLGACVLISLAVYFGWARPFLRHKELQAKQRSALAVQNQECSRLAASIEAVKGQLAVVKQELTESRFDVNTIDRINQRIARLTSFFSECRLTVNNVQAGQPYRGLPYLVLPIHITGTGSCPQYARLLHRFSNEFADMSVTTAAMTGYPAKTESQEDFQIELVWYAAPAAERSVGQVAKTSDVVSKL